MEINEWTGILGANARFDGQSLPWNKEQGAARNPLLAP